MNPEITPDQVQVPEPGNTEAIDKLRKQLLDMKKSNIDWGKDLMAPSAGSKRVPAQLNQSALVRNRLELLINFIMPEAGETEAIRLTFEVRYQQRLAKLHQELEEQAVEEYKRQTKQTLHVPGKN